MREIKFRAWDRKEKKMIYDALEIKNIGLGEGSVVVDGRTQQGNELDWMQWTGLKDKKGVEIYEGDFLSDGNISKIVEWDYAGAGFYTSTAMSRAWVNCEVVTNVYEK